MIVEPISTKIISVRIVGISRLLFPTLQDKHGRLQRYFCENGSIGIPIAVIKQALVSAADGPVIERTVK